MKRKLKLFSIALFTFSIIVLGAIVYGFRKLSSRKRKRKLEERYYRASNPNWKKRQPPPRMIYREHDFEYYDESTGNKHYWWKNRRSPRAEDTEIMAVFWGARLVLLMGLVVGLPIFIFSFEETSSAYTMLFITYLFVDIVARLNGWHKVRG